MLQIQGLEYFSKLIDLIYLGIITMCTLGLCFRVFHFIMIDEFHSLRLRGNSLRQKKKKRCQFPGDFLKLSVSVKAGEMTLTANPGTRKDQILYSSRPHTLNSCRRNAIFSHQQREMIGLFV